MRTVINYRTSLKPCRPQADGCDIHPISPLWRERFGDVVPAAFVLREAIPERWLRIHSLPDAKRYPDTGAEYEEVLKRHNRVATEVLGEGEVCVLMFCCWEDVTRWPRSGVLPRQLDGRTPELVQRWRHDGDLISSFAAPVVWRAGLFDDIIRACANDQAGPMLFANFARRSIYAPYDGGADLFFPTQDERDDAARRCRDWLSKRPDGL